MKNLLKLTAVYLMLAYSSLFAHAQETQDIDNLEIQPMESSFIYVNGGIKIDKKDILPAPSLGFGYRAQIDHHGLDLSASIATRSTDLAKVKTGFLYQYFFKPSLHSQIYVGAGAAVNYHLEKDKFRHFFTPEFVLGKQKNNTFLQIQTDFKSINLNYGIGF